MTLTVFASLSAKASVKDAKGDDLDQVSGNAEDDIGDNLAFIRESELLYGDESLLALYGPLVSDICASPNKYKVRFCSKSCDIRDQRSSRVLSSGPCPSNLGRPLPLKAHVRQLAVL